MCVELANIAVYFVLRCVLYSDKQLMSEIIGIRRYIDDGIGIHTMTKRKFDVWNNVVSERVSEFGLKIKKSDWSVPAMRHGPINFLDISFSFDEKRSLQTDLYRKPTDSRSYLNFSSCHPNHTFSGIIHSQAARIRRIVNDEERLCLRLDELAESFVKCGYPKKMVKNIVDSMKRKPRLLEKKKKVLSSFTDDDIVVVSTFGADKKLTKILDRVQSNSKNMKFKYVHKTGPSLKNLLCKSKDIALGSPQGRTMGCKRPTCQSCGLMSKVDKIRNPNKKFIKTAKTSCTTCNAIYHAECKHCAKSYVGKTTQPLRGRISGHRAKYKECLNICNGKDVELSDEHLLGLHLLHTHQLREQNAFNDGYKFTVLEVCNPRELDLKEHKWIQKLKCINPHGLNSHDPFGIPLIL